MEVTNDTLQAVGVENVATLNVYNKADLAGIRYPEVNDDSIWLSAKTGKGMDELVELIKKKVFGQYITCKLLIPFDRGDLVSYLNDKANVKTAEYEEDGTLMTVEMNVTERTKFEEFIISH